MEGGIRRATISFFILSIVYVSKSSCQNVLLEGESRAHQQSPSIDSSRDTSAKAQLMNTLISIASGKKGFPEMAPVSQVNTIQDKSAIVNQNQRQSFNVMSMSPQTNALPKDAIALTPVLATSSLPQPVISNTMSNVMIPASFSPAYSAPYMRSYQPVMMPAQACSARPPQVIPLENYANIVQSYPGNWQLPQAASFPSVVYAEPSVSPINLDMSPSNPSTILPTIQTESGLYDVISVPPTLPAQEPVVVMNDREALPFNVQINVPPQNVAAPRITLVSAAPNPPSNPNPPVSPYNYPPPMPIIMRKSRSSWKSILPIILIALFNDRDSYGGCCCPCNCGCNFDSPTPIPYPIPIPVNNPIINNGGSSLNRSHRRGNNQNEDYNDEN